MELRNIALLEDLKTKEWNMGLVFPKFHYFHHSNFPFPVFDHSIIPVFHCSIFGFHSSFCGLGSPSRMRCENAGSLSAA